MYLLSTISKVWMPVFCPCHTLYGLTDPYFSPVWLMFPEATLAADRLRLRSAAKPRGNLIACVMERWQPAPSAGSGCCSSSPAHTGVGSSSSVQGGPSPPAPFHRHDQASSRCCRASRSLPSRDHGDAALTFRRFFLPDSEMNLKCSLKRLLLMSFSISHLLLLEGEFRGFASWTVYVRPELSTQIWAFIRPM